MQFEWDEDKADKNESKHGVGFEEALSCFYDLNQIAFYDEEHSDEEDREILIAHSNKGRLLLVVYIIKGKVIRIISARKATKRETADYEKGI